VSGFDVYAGEEEIDGKVARVSWRLVDVAPKVNAMRTEIAELREQCRRADFERLAMKGVRDDLVELVKTYACSIRQLGIFGRPKFAVFDEEGEILTEADTVEEAARLAIRFIENRE
jgi:hypothetical protein